MEHGGAPPVERPFGWRIGLSKLGLDLDAVGRLLAPVRVAVPRAGRTPWLDGWRGLSIVMVLLGHFAPGDLGFLAPLGVEMFFVLSGRLMAQLLIVRRQRLTTFVFHRASRILPLLALYVGIVGAGLALAGMLKGTAVHWLSPVASLLFFSNYLNDPAPLLQHTWSLAVEEHSYVLLVGVAAVSARKPTLAWWIGLVAATAMVINGAAIFYGWVDRDSYVFWRSDVRGASIALSFSLCLLARKWQASDRAYGLAWMSPLCLLGAVACSLHNDPATWPQVSGCAVLTAISVNTIQFAGQAYRRVLSQPRLIWFGTLSFSLYIWQQPFFLAVKGGLPVVVAVPLTFVCATWSFARIEAPARRYLNAHGWLGSVRRRDDDSATGRTRRHIPLFHRRRSAKPAT